MYRGHTFRCCTSFFGQKLDDFLAHKLFAVTPLPVELAIPPIPHIASLVDKIHGRPDRVAPSLPVLQSAVNGDREFESMLPSAFADLLDDLFPLGFGRVNADDRETLLIELFLPALVPRVVMDAVNSAERPEMERDDLPAKLGECERGGIDPDFDVAQLGSQGGQHLHFRQINRLPLQGRPAILLHGCQDGEHVRFEIAAQFFGLTVQLGTIFRGVHLAPKLF
jgi:hypothetical protein